MSANIREQRLAVGFHKQAAVQTALTASSCMALTKINPTPFVVAFEAENDGPAIGKDDEFPLNNYLTNQNISGSIDGNLSSQWAAIVAAFGLGKAVKEEAGDGYKYTCTPLPPVEEEIEMPATTIVETIRQGPSAVIDRALVGCVIEEFGFQFNRGTGLQNSRFSSQWIGAKQESPSTIVMPAAATQHLLKGGETLEMTVLAVDYVAAKTIEQVEFRWRNNIRDGFFPGSGSSDGAQIRGRQEHGDRVAELTFVARVGNGSTELSNMLTQTEGTAVISVTGAEISSGVNHKMVITVHRAQINSAVVGETEGIVSVAVALLIMKHAVNGALTIEVWTDKDEILAAAA